MKRRFWRGGAQAQPPVTGPGTTVEASAERTVAIGGNNYAPVLTGDHSWAVSLPPEALRPAAEVAAPAGLDALAVRPGLFVGRVRELERLDAALAGPGGAVVQAVHGLGGIGKSTLAAHWVATRAHGHAPVRWITADSAVGVQEGLADLARALQPALSHALPTEALAEWALQWLAAHSGWLLILDNVNDPADIAVLMARAGASGRFLITSRLATPWHNIPTVVRLDVLDEAEALDLLTRIVTAAGPRDLDGAAELCAELGHLPLAVEQVAAYLAQSPLITPRAYLEMLDQYPAVMYGQGAIGVTPSERTIARIWRITLDQIADREPLAVDLLRLLAWYAPDQIPATILDGLAEPPALHAALGLLTAYSMITSDPTTGTLAVHRLVQALARTPDSDDPHRAPRLVDQGCTHATTQLHNALPTDFWDAPETWPAWRALLPHVDALADAAPADTDTESTASLFSSIGLFLKSQGQLTRATSHLERARTGMARVQGKSHPHTLLVCHNLAHVYQAAKDVRRTVPLLEEALTDMVRVLGEDHSLTLFSRSNLAGAYQEAGDVSRAIPLFEEALTDMVRVLGEDHPETLASRTKLAGAYQEVGQLSRAISLYEQALADRLRVLGEAHPATLRSRNSLAGAYGAAGDVSRAIPLFEQILTDTVQVLGEDHPSTLNSRSNLAGAYQEVGQLSRAIPLFEEALTDKVRVLGEDHPDTLTSRKNLAHAYRRSGDVRRAIPLFKQALDDRLRVLGEDHPDTLTSRNDLAGAYLEAGKVSRAISLYQQTLTVAARVLGEDHPDTLTFRGNLAGAYREAGKVSRAISLYEQALDDRLRVLGEDHPSTLVSRSNLAGAYLEAGKVSRAISLYEQNLIVAARVLGEDHPDALKYRNNLAYAYRAAGDVRRAILMFEQILTDKVRVLGEHHPSTLAARSNLAGTHALAGEVRRAIALFEETLTDMVRVLGEDHPWTVGVRNDLAAVAEGYGSEPS
ncbi:tetratricopeptide repeat protein [Streptomyces sp. NPDC059639]|uniref:tetratricopeptide repeat protein n=1 Tax=Streptomyces sp. NPDC059639 TaxID=3346891 RepID=UPI0036973A32